MSYLLNLIFRVTSGQNENGETEKLDCCKIFYCAEKTPSAETFHALNQSSLVFDGKLVIESNFITSDKYIMAAGCITKYASRYKTKWMQEYYNSREVGFEVRLNNAKLF